MNIKERLNITKKVQQNSEKQSNNSKLKFDNNIVINIISEKINNFNNIIFITENTYNKNTVSAYFSNCINTENKITTPSSFKSIKNETINIFPSVSGELLVKILEQTLMGVKSFVLGISLNSYENVIEKLETLIAVNSNLSEKQINLLFSESNTILVNVKQDETGAFYVKDIDKIQIENAQLALNNLYTYIDKPEEETTQFEPVVIKNEQLETTTQVKETLPIETVAPKKQEEIQDKEENNNKIEEQAAEEISIEDSINEIIEQNVISEEEITTNEDTKEDHIVEEENSSDSTDITHTTDSQEQTEETKPIEPSEQAKIEPINEIQNETQNEVLVQNEEQAKEEQPLAQQKVNKYKLLKEKIRNKRNA